MNDSDFSAFKKILREEYPSALAFIESQSSSLTPELINRRGGTNFIESQGSIPKLKKAPSDAPGHVPFRDTASIQEGQKTPSEGFQKQKASQGGIKIFPQKAVILEKDKKAMDKAVRLLFQLKSRNDYKQKLNPSLWPDFGQDAVLNTYDFHITDQGPRLIEANTNGAGFLLINALLRLQGETGQAQASKQQLKKAFQAEWDKFRKNSNSGAAPKTVVLIDEEPLNQILAVEFFMYRDFFASMGWPPCEILDSQSLKIGEKGHLRTPSGQIADFIYNRVTDFYFERHPHLLKAFKQGLSAFSPHPLEYLLLADKHRLRDWTAHKEQYEELRALGDLLPPAEILNPDSRDRLWANRKRHFFKPLRGFASRRAYRGKSISRKKFEGLLNDGGVLAQEFVPPSVTKDQYGEEWKTDFRAYVYEDKIQQLGARCYKGQVTNFKNEGGGWAAVAILP